MLVKKKGAGQGDDRFFIIMGDTFTGLQACDRTTAEVLKFLIQQRSGASLGARAFASKARVATVDHYAAILKAERSLKMDLDCLSLVVGCEAHSVAGIHTKAMALMDADISGALHLALAVEMAGTMAKFQESIKQTVIARLVWPPARGQPPAAATLYRLRCIQALTIGWTRSSTMQRRALLRLLPLGDWRKRDCVEIFVDESVEELPPKEDFAWNIANSLTQGLAWHKLAKYPRSRWLGCEAAISQPILLDACHGLLRPSFEHFCMSVGKLQDHMSGCSSTNRKGTRFASVPVSTGVGMPKPMLGIVFLCGCPGGR